MPGRTEVDYWLEGKGSWMTSVQRAQERKDVKADPANSDVAPFCLGYIQYD